MNRVYYSVYDSKAERFLPPFLTENDATAKRLFCRACSDEDHDFHRFAEDYTLFRLGEFDEVEGILIPEEKPQSIIRAIHTPRLEVSNG